MYVDRSAEAGSPKAKAATTKLRLVFQDVSNHVERDGPSKLGKTMAMAQKQKRTVDTIHTDFAAFERKKSASIRASINKDATKSTLSKITFPSQASRSSSSRQDDVHAGTIATSKAHDIDKRDSNDPLMCSNYVKDMFQYFRDQESRTMVAKYISDNEDAIQPRISERMRAILIDWLADIHNKMKCDPTVLHLTVQILDRFLASGMLKATKKNLQLIGASAFFISSKYEEVYPVVLCDLIYVCDRLYTEEDIIDMETTILKALSYQISLPTSHTFLKRFLKAAHADKKLEFLAQYILETSLHSFNMVVKYTPSELAAASVLIGRMSIGRHRWSPTLEKYAGYTEEDITSVACNVMEENKKMRFGLTAVKRKYSRGKYYKVSSVVLPSASLL